MCDLFLVLAPDVPCKGVTTYGTIGLSARAQKFQGKDVIVELVGACASATTAFDNLIASCAIESLKNGTNVFYGAVIEDILDQYKLSVSMRHVTFVSPFLWDGFKEFNLLGKEIHWLMVLPISDAELEFLETRGIDALEEYFEDKQIDIYDINRRSTL